MRIIAESASTLSTRVPADLTPASHIPSPHAPLCSAPETGQSSAVRLLRRGLAVSDGRRRAPFHGRVGRVPGCRRTGESAQVSFLPRPRARRDARSISIEVPGASRYALRRRRSLQQKDEEGCCASSLAATADEVSPPDPFRGAGCPHEEATARRGGREPRGFRVSSLSLLSAFPQPSRSRDSRRRAA